MPPLMSAATTSDHSTRTKARGHGEPRTEADDPERSPPSSRRAATVSEITLGRPDDTGPGRGIRSVECTSPKMLGNVGIGLDRDLAAEASELLPPNYALRTQADKSGRGRPVVVERSPAAAILLLGAWFRDMKDGTKTQYTRRTRQFLKRINAQHADPFQLDGRTALAVARSLHGRDVSHSSTRQYRSAVAAAIAGSLVAADAAAKPELLIAYFVADATQIGQPPTAREPNEASCADGGRHAQNTDRKVRAVWRRKALPQDDLTAIVTALNSSKSPRRRELVHLLATLYTTGVRPCEVRQMALRQPPNDVARLTVLNAKHDDEGIRAHGRTRTLTWDRLSERAARAIEASIAYARRFDAHEWEVEREALQRVLRTTYRRAFPRRRIPAVLYDARHQFAADMKAATKANDDGAAVVAAVMGHATDGTANRNYARAGAGRRWIMPGARPSEVERVRRIERVDLMSLSAMRTGRSARPRP